MQSFKYFTQEGNVYIKTPQKGLYYAVAIFLFAIAVIAYLYGNKTNGNKVVCALFAILGLIILLRASAVTRFDVVARTITAQSFFFTSPNVFHFEDFQNFLITKQILLITINATATMIIEKNGKQRNLLLHQTMFFTKPLQRVTDEAAQIMGIDG